MNHIHARHRQIYSKSPNLSPLLAPPINPVEGASEGEYLYLFSNDANLGNAYRSAQELRVQNATEKSRFEAAYATMIVGNGSFESALGLIPQEDLVLFCDSNSFTLFFQRVTIETIRNSQNRQEFLNAMGLLIQEIGAEGWLQKLPEFRVNETLRTEIPPSSLLDGREEDWDMRQWRSSKSGIPEFFTTTNEAYEAARANVLRRPFAFFSCRF